MQNIKWDTTADWNRKTSGEQYNLRVNYYNTVDLHWNMYNDNQWVGIKAMDLPKHQYNICQQGTDFIISSLLSRPIEAEYSAENIPEPLANDTSPEAILNRSIRQNIGLLSKWAKVKWEKEKMPKKLRELLLDAACSGDMCAHVYWDSNIETQQDETGDFRVELLDGANVMFGNPNTHEVQSQPYILVIGRDTVANLKREAKENKVKQDLIERIMSDEDTEYMIGERGKIELENSDDENGKTTYIIYYWRDRDTNRIFWNKSTKYCTIRSEVDSGMKLYPIIWGNWRTIKHSYHGLSAIAGIIHNQISINQMAAMITYYMRNSAFGKTIVDRTKIPKGAWSNRLGEVIYADGDVQNIVKQLDAGQLNTAIITFWELAIKHTKDFIGANEAALGQINPERASGTAIMLNAKQAAIPHENILANLEQFVEDLYLVEGEFFFNKYKNRILYVMGEDGKLVGQQYDSEIMDKAMLSCKVNVGQSTIFSFPMLQQNLDNLAKMGPDWITPAEYYERIASLGLIPDAQKLVASAKLREMEKAQMMKLQQEMAMAGLKGLPSPDQMTGANAPELQGNMGATAQNSMKTSQLNSPM